MMRPSSGTTSSWMLKPLPSLCGQALPMRVKKPLAFAVADVVGDVARAFSSRWFRWFSCQSCVFSFVS